MVIMITINKTKNLVKSELQSNQSLQSHIICPNCKQEDFKLKLCLHCKNCKNWFYFKSTNEAPILKNNEHWRCLDCNHEKTPQQVQDKVDEDSRHSMPQNLHPNSATTSSSTTTETTTSTTTTSNTIITTTTTTIITKTITINAISSAEQVTEPIVVVDGDETEFFCSICNLLCNQSSLLICTDPLCNKSFHFKCLNLPNKPVDEASWFCEICLERQQYVFRRKTRRYNRNYSRNSQLT